MTTFSYPYQRDCKTGLTTAIRNEPEYEISVHGICFADWLNEIDARIDYDVRRQIPVSEWRHLYDFSYSVKDACLMALTGRVR